MCKDYTIKQLSVLEKMCRELLKKWNTEIKNFEINHQFEKYSIDNQTTTYSKYKQLVKCADHLTMILETSNIKET